jgi:hypothetical protein
MYYICIRIKPDKYNIMITIAARSGYIVQFNGSSTYFVSYEHGRCIQSFPTERRALNYFNKLV